MDLVPYRLEAGIRAYYASSYRLEDTCNHQEIKCWVVKKYLFNTSASQWGGSISKPTWKEFENVQKHFLTMFLQVNKKMSYILLRFKMGSLPVEIMAMERVLEYMIKV